MFKEVQVSPDHLKSRRKEKVHGVGINDAPYYTSLVVEDETHYCPYYTRWKKMLSSCYSTKNGSGKKKSVCKEWLSFMAFRRWMKQQNWQRKELTHWLRVPGSAIYSPATCLFVTKRVRSLFPSTSGSKIGRVRGVSPVNDRFVVTCSSGGRGSDYVGSFATQDEAIEAYVIAKENEACQIAASLKDVRLIQAVLDYSRYFSAQKRLLRTACY